MEAQLISNVMGILIMGAGLLLGIYLHHRLLLWRMNRKWRREAREQARQHYEKYGIEV